MPCTSEAVRHFEEKGVAYGPAKAANAGGLDMGGAAVDLQCRVALPSGPSHQPASTIPQ